MAKAVTMVVKLLVYRDLSGDGLAFKPSPSRHLNGFLVRHTDKNGLLYDLKYWLLSCSLIAKIMETVCFSLRNKLFPKEKQVVPIVGTPRNKYLNDARTR